MGAAVRTVTPVPLDARAWEPFGWLPVPDTDPDDGRHRLEFAWNDVHVNRIGHDLDEVPAITGGLRCEELFRHLTHTQVVMPLDAEAVIAVAAPDVVMDAPADAGRVVAFLLQPLQAVVLHRGTWHWGPYPVGAESVELFNVQGLRYREDNERVDLGAIGVSVDVLLGG
jgi:ureidoglycolate hydrolase